MRLYLVCERRKEQNRDLTGPCRFGGWQGPLTADRELLTERLVVVLEEAENGVAVDAEADHAGAAVDLGDRIGRDEASVTREKARADRDRVRHIGGAAVHGRLHGADDLALRIGDEKSDRAEQVWSRDAHDVEAIRGL